MNMLLEIVFRGLDMLIRFGSNRLIDILLGRVPVRHNDSRAHCQSGSSEFKSSPCYSVLHASMLKDLLWRPVDIVLGFPWEL